MWLLSVFISSFGIIFGFFGLFLRLLLAFCRVLKKKEGKIILRQVAIKNPLETLDTNLVR